MSTLTNIQLTTKLTASQLASLINFKADSHDFTITLGNFVTSNAGGLHFGQYNVNLGATQATGILTLTGAPTNGSSFTIGNVALTAVTSGAGAGSFNIGSTVTITAANIAAAVNSYGSTSPFVSATSAAGVVTFTSLIAGAVGNGIQLATNLGSSTVTSFSGGSNGTSYTFSIG